MLRSIFECLLTFEDSDGDQKYIDKKSKISPLPESKRWEVGVSNLNGAVQSRVFWVSSRWMGQNLGWTKKVTLNFWWISIQNKLPSKNTGVKWSHWHHPFLELSPSEGFVLDSFYLLHGTTRPRRLPFGALDHEWRRFHGTDPLGTTFWSWR